MLKQSYAKKRFSEFFIVYGVVSLMFGNLSLIALVFALFGVSYLVRAKTENNQILEHLIKKTKVEKELLSTLFNDEKNQECYNLNKRAVESLLKGKVTKENRENLIVLLQANKWLVRQGENYTECKSLIIEKIISEFCESEVRPNYEHSVVGYSAEVEKLDDLFEESFLHIDSKDLLEGGEE